MVRPGAARSAQLRMRSVHHRHAHSVAHRARPRPTSLQQLLLLLPTHTPQRPFLGVSLPPNLTGSLHLPAAPVQVYRVYANKREHVVRATAQQRLCRDSLWGADQTAQELYASPGVAVTKSPRPHGLNNRNVFFLAVLEARCPRSTCRQGGFPLWSLSLACKWLCLCCFFPCLGRWAPVVLLCVPVSSSYRMSVAVD